MPDFNTLVDEARFLYDAAKYKEATKKFLSSLKYAHDDMEKAKVWAELCWTFYNEKSFQQAIDAAENVLEFDKMYGAKDDLYRLMGYCYFALENDTLAEKFLLKSLEGDNTSDKQKYVAYELGKLYFRNQRYKEAEEYLLMTEEFFKNNAPDYWISMLFFKGFSKFYMNNLGDAEIVFKEIVTNTDDGVAQSNGLYGQAYIEFEKKNYLTTINICENITKLNPNFFDMESLGFMMAASFFYLGRYDVFKQYYHQMKVTYKDGRYLEELTRLESQIPNQDSNTTKN